MSPITHLKSFEGNLCSNFINYMCLVKGYNLLSLCTFFRYAPFFFCVMFSLSIYGQSLSISPRKAAQIGYGYTTKIDRK